MLDVLEDPPCAWLVCVRMCNKKSSKVSQRDVSQQFLQVWAVFVHSELQVLGLLPWCAWPSWAVGDSRANPEAAPYLLFTGAARDLAPQACCRMGSLWDHWLLPPLEAGGSRAALGARKVSGT